MTAAECRRRYCVVDAHTIVYITYLDTLDRILELFVTVHTRLLSVLYLRENLG